MDLVVEVGDWEHACCGPPIERNQVVDLRCIRRMTPDGQVRLIESHHGGLGVAADERVHGRVLEIRLVRTDGTSQAILRLPGGPALRGVDDSDDGHLEDPWTGEVIPSESPDFLVTVRSSPQPG